MQVRQWGWGYVSVLKKKKSYSVGPLNNGVTESLFIFLFFIFLGGRAKGEPDLHLGGGGARGRHRNEGCTIKSQMGDPWCEWGVMTTQAPP